MDGAGFNAIQVGLFISLYCLVFLAAFVGNTVVLLVCYKSTRVRTSPLTCYVSNLAAADLLFTLLTVFDLSNFLEWWMGGQLSCKLQGFLIEVCYTTSIMTLVLINRLRLKAITAPLVIHTKRRTSWTLLILWLVGTVVCAPLLYGYSVIERDGVVICTNNGWHALARQAFYTTHAILLFVLPLIYMLYVQLTIFKRLRTNVLPLSVQHSIRRARKQRRIGRLLAVVTATFVVAWCPFITVRSLFYFHVRSDVIDKAWKASQLLVFSSAAANPVLYGLHSARFRESFKQLTLCKKRGLQVSQLGGT